MIHPRLILLWLGLLAVCTLLVFHYDPARPSARVLRAGLWGLALVIGWNALSLPHIGVNPLSVLLAGSLGLPGLAALSVLAMLA